MSTFRYPIPPPDSTDPVPAPRTAAPATTLPAVQAVPVSAPLIPSSLIPPPSTPAPVVIPAPVQTPVAAKAPPATAPSQNLTVQSSQEPSHAFREIRTDDGKLLLRIRKESLTWFTLQLRESLAAIYAGEIREIGGLITGDAKHVPGTPETLLDFVPVAIRHLFGSEYRPFEMDLRAFNEVVARYPSGQKSRVAACYRSHITGDVEVREEDTWVLQRMFGDQGGLLIIFQVLPLRNLRASVHQRPVVVHIYSRVSGTDVRLAHRFPLLEGDASVNPGMALQAVESRMPARMDGPVNVNVSPGAPAVAASAAQPSLAAPAMAAIAAPAAIPPAPSPALGAAQAQASLPPPPPLVAVAPPQRSFVLPGIAAVLAGGLLTGAVMFVMRRPPAAPEKVVTAPVAAPANAVELSLEPHGNKSELHWNVASAAAKGAVHATLVIVDNSGPSRIELNSAQLAAGSYEFKAVAGSVMCQIMFYQPNETFAGETRQFSVSLPGTPAAPTPAARNAAPPAPSSAPVTTAVAKPNLPAASTPAPAAKQPSVNLSEASPTRPQPAFVPPPQTTTANNRPPIPQVDTPPSIGAAAPLIPTVISSVEIPQPRSPVNLGALSAPGTQDQSFVGPVPVTRVAPAVPSSVKSMMHGPETVRIIAKVNAEGKVIDARPVNGHGPNTIELMLYAVQAAKGWRFQPARKDGIPVAAETEMQFNFSR